MKAGVNGGVNFSVLDGWWDEGWPATTAGRSAGGRRTPDEGAQDWADVQDLYRLLEEEIVPRYYERDAAGVPIAWVDQMRRSMASTLCGSRRRGCSGSTVEQMYLPAAAPARAAAEEAGAESAPVTTRARSRRSRAADGSTAGGRRWFRRGRAADCGGSSRTRPSTRRAALTTGQLQRLQPVDRWRIRHLQPGTVPARVDSEKCPLARRPLRAIATAGPVRRDHRAVPRRRARRSWRAWATARTKARWARRRLVGRDRVGPPAVRIRPPSRAISSP
jgi:hypothetical protein